MLYDTITLVAAVRSPAKAKPFEDQGIRTVILDFEKKRPWPRRCKASIAPCS